jgi:hypothetical protein
MDLIHFINTLRNINFRIQRLEKRRDTIDETKNLKDIEHQLVCGLSLDEYKQVKEEMEKAFVGWF